MLLLQCYMMCLLILLLNVELGMLACKFETCLNFKASCLFGIYKEFSLEVVPK